MGTIRLINAPPFRGQLVRRGFRFISGSASHLSSVVRLGRTKGEARQRSTEIQRRRKDDDEYEDEESRLHRESAINWQVYPGNEARDRGGEPEYGIGDLLGSTKTTDRMRRE